MVASNIFHEFRVVLEEFWLEQNNYKLDGTGFDLILLEPSALTNKYSILISAKQFDMASSPVVINKTMDFIKTHNKVIYGQIARLNIIASSNPFVKNIAFLNSYQKQNVFELRDVSLGGITISNAFILKNNIRLLKNFPLKNIVSNRVIHLSLIDGSMIPAGVIRITKQFKLVYYNAKGLRELFFDIEGKAKVQQEQAKVLREKSEAFLMQNNYISQIDYSQIENVLAS